MVSASRALYQVEALWDHIYGDGRGEIAISAYTKNSPDATFQTDFFAYPGQTKEAAEHALRLSESGYDVWHCAHLLTNRRRVKENAAPVTALYVDGDGAQVPDNFPQPTAVVRSSPGREQLYWRLSMPVPPATGEDLNRRLAYAIGADKSGWDLTQLLRPPGTRNFKYPDAPLVEIVNLGEVLYAAADLDRILPRLPEGTKNGHQKDVVGDNEPPVSLGPDALKVWRGEKPKAKDTGELDRSGTLLKIGRVLYDAGANRSVIVEALRERDRALGYKKYTGRTDADKQYQAIVDVLEREGRNESIPINLNGSDKKTASKPTPPTHDELRDRWIDGNPNHAYGLSEWRLYEEGIWPVVSETAIKAQISNVLEG